MQGPHHVGPEIDYYGLSCRDSFFDVSVGKCKCHNEKNCMLGIIRPRASVAVLYNLC